MSAAAHHVDSTIPDHVRSAILRAMGRTFGRVYAEGRGWAVVCHVDGVRYRIRSASFDNGKNWVALDRELAETVLDAIRAEIRAGAPPLAAIAPYLRSHAPQRTFRVLWEQFTEAKFRQGQTGGRQLSRERTSELLGHQRRGHLAALLELPVDRITYKVLDDWSQGLFRDGLSSGSVHHLVADVGTFLRWLARRQEIAAAPELPTVRIRRSAPRVPDPATQARLFDAIPWALRGVFLARGQHGLRPSEARRARVADWSIDPQPIRLRDGTEIACHALAVRGKGYRNRTIPVPVGSDLARWVGEFAAKRFGAEPLFRNPSADPDGDGSWSSSATRRVWVAACTRAYPDYDGKGIAPWEENQSMRHAYATALVNQGSGLDEVGAVLGHSDTRTTKRYAQLGIGAHAGVLRPVKP
jgi:site-specific recombinase XerD